MCGDGTEHAELFLCRTTVDVDGSNRLVFPKEHGFADGEQVVYTANGGRVIAGLESGKRYFVKLVDAKTIQLATTSGGTAINLAATGLDQFGTDSRGESFTPVTGTWTTFTPSSAVTTTRSRADQLTYASPHGLADGSAVIYRANGAPIAGLVDGEPCDACHAAGWVTILGAGMVHPAVFREFGFDPNEVSGIAFGLGTTRMASQLTGVRPRGLYEQDLRVFANLQVRP
jgi:hypothetical protein